MSIVTSTIETTELVTGFTHSEIKAFVRDHFEEFMNRRNLSIGDVNYVPEFLDHGADLPVGVELGPSGPKTHMEGVFKKFPDIHVIIEDLVAEGDKVVVRNTWTAAGTEKPRPMAR